MQLLRYLKGRTAAYALAHAAKTLFWASSDVYFAFYLTEVCGISAASMGLIMAASYLANAVLDWRLGHSLAARVRSARGAGQLQLFGAALSSATLLLFGLSALSTVDWRLSSALAALLAFRASYALYDLPQNALLALAAKDERERSRMAAARLAVSGIARVTLTALFVPLFVRRGIDMQITSFLVLAALMGVIGVCSAGLLARTLRRDTVVASGESRPYSPRQGKGLYIAMLVLSLGTTVFSQLEPYLAAWVLTSRWTAAALLTAVALGTSLSQPLWLALVRRSSQRTAAIAALCVSALSACLFPPIASVGGPFLAVIGLSYGAGVGGLFFALWSAVARLATRDHAQRGATATLGSFAACAKVGQAAALGLTGLYLQRLHALEPMASAVSIALMMAIAVLAALGAVTVLGLTATRLLRAQSS
ncbi:MFS transporter [Novosphingobium sp. ZW T3_23]|uniref:MFS transporter n=1 Tax=Novosphingobium sp. ZW T3_23 TaxID=3378084 RepID=UPI00385238AA